MEIMKDAKKMNSPQKVFSKWKKICDHDMKECEKDYLRKASFKFKQLFKNTVLEKFLQVLFLAMIKIS